MNSSFGYEPVIVAGQMTAKVAEGSQVGSNGTHLSSAPAGERNANATHNTDRQERHDRCDPASYHQGGWAWTIRVKELEYLSGPTNLQAEFMVNEQRVRFDFLPLRRANRCKEANPIEVLSMVKMK